MAIKKEMFYINGVERALYFDYEKDSLAAVLRRYGLTGLKVGCGTGQCGTCTVIVDGEPVRSCIKKMKALPAYAKIETIEGIGIASNLHPLQRAWIKYGGVQCGFCTPGFIMSAKALLDKNPDVTREDVRNWFSKNNNLCRCTGYKPLVDATMAAAAVMSGKAPMSSLDPEVPEDGDIFHTRYPRPAALGKVMGVTDYSGDIDQKMPDETLKLAIKLPDIAHAYIKNIDVSEAKKMPGVEAVITAEDITEGSNDMGGALAHKRCKVPFDHIYALNDKKIRRSGDAIAIVAARTREEARAAVEKIKVEYDPLPVYDNLLESSKPDAVQVIDGVDNCFVFQPVLKGDAEKVFKEAETNPDITVVQGSYHSSRQPHLSLEPDAAQSFYDEEGVLTVVYKTQYMAGPLNGIPKVLGIDKCRVIESPTGASFGAAMRYDCACYAAIATYCTGKPTSLVFSYAEKQIVTGKRGNHFANYRAAVNKDGKIIAGEFDSALEGGGIVGSVINNVFKGARFPFTLYNVPNIKGLCRGVMANNSYVTAYRGAGSPEMYTGSEQMVDQLAREIGMDPYEFRFKNVVREGDLTINNRPFKLYPLEDMMNQFRPVYEAAKAWKAEPAEEGWVRGVGVCIGGYHVSFPVDNAEVALELLPDGRIAHYNTWEMQGQGADIGTLAQTVEALKPLGVGPDDIVLIQNDTRMCPITGPAGASRSHYMAGNATIIAANDLMNAMRKEDGTYRTYDEMKAEGIQTYYKGVYNTKYLGYSQLEPNRGEGDPMPDQNFILNVIRVEVQPSTGKTRIVAANSIADVGVVGNYLALEGQAYSGIFQSMGYAISESYSDFEKKCMTPLGCGFLRCNEVPDDFTIEFHETPRVNGPFGAGGASECFESVSHTGVLNAIYDAVGVRVYDMPATPQKLKAAIDKKAAGEKYAPEPFVFGPAMDDALAEIAANPINADPGATSAYVTK